VDYIKYGLFKYRSRKEGGGLISPIEWRMITDDSLSPLIHFIKKKKG
jgi:hypothetical protein